MPASRENYGKAISKEGLTFPLKFCKHRWIENVPVMERALSVLLDLSKYVKAVGEKQYPDPGTKFFETVTEASNDKLLFARFHFALSVSKQVTSFYLFYQTDKPVLLFMAGDLYTLLKSFMSRFLKRGYRQSHIGRQNNQSKGD